MRPTCRKKYLKADTIAMENATESYPRTIIQTYKIGSSLVPASRDLY